MPKLTVDTKASLYEPVEVEIDGKIFQVKKMTKEIIQKLAELDALVRKGKTYAIFQRVELMIGKSEEVSRLGVGEAIKIMKFIIDTAFNPEPAEKNLLRPGQEKLL